MTEQFIHARCRKGSPFPSALRNFMSEQEFYALRDQCEQAPSEEEFQNAISRFNSMYNGQLALRGTEEHHSAAELVLESVITLGGFLGATKQSRDRYLVFDTFILLNGRNNAGGTPIVYANAVPIQAQSGAPNPGASAPVAQPISYASAVKGNSVIG